MRAYILGLVLTVLLAAAPAGAADECGPEWLRLCGHVAGQDQHLIAACLTEHLKEFTPSCGEAARVIIRNVNETEYCRADFYDHCGYDGPIPPAVEDIERIFPCLIQNYEKFTMACRGYLDKNVQEMKK